jgi:hypothetical protein
MTEEKYFYFAGKDGELELKLGKMMYFFELLKIN